MKTVWKFQLPNVAYKFGTQALIQIGVPKDSKIIDCLYQPFVSGGKANSVDDSYIVIYAEVQTGQSGNHTEPTDIYNIYIQGTGKPWIVEDGASFLRSIEAYP
jgi:hypothetical protein